MKPSAPTSSYRLLVGVAIAYRDFTAAVLRPGEQAQSEPKAFAQTSEGFEHLQQRLTSSGLEPAVILIVMEATSSYWMALATTLHQAGFAVSVINPAQAHHFAKAQLKRAKNAVLDAQILAELAQALVPERWTPPPALFYELHQRLAQRARFLELRTQVSNQQHALSAAPVIVPAVRQRNVELLASINQHIAQLETELLALVKVEQESEAKAPIEGEEEPTDALEKRWKAASALLLTIPGSGRLTACWLVVATRNFTLCETAEAAVHYVGLAPMLHSSGTSVRGQAHIGHSGHARARTQLYLATLAAARFNPLIKASSERLRAAGKPMKVARCACAGKLLHLAYAVVTHEQAFDPHDQAVAKRETAAA